MSDFKAWYERKYKVPYPGRRFESSDVILRRLTDAIAAYVDEKLPNA